MAIRDKIITPNVPEVLQEQKIQTYVPKASTTQAGIASFRGKDFFVDPKGEVSLSKDLSAIDEKATQALTNSQEAVNTANQAEDIAESAMDMVTEMEGSKIYIENEFQMEMHVKEDIQTQFDNITSKISAEASEENLLADKNYIQDQIHGLLSTQIVLGMEGIIEANRVVFTVNDSDSFIEYRTNNREFFITAYLPVVLANKDDLNLSMPVNITFGDTTYNLYNYILGTATTMTIGQLMSTHSYSKDTGFFFNFKATFFENSDVVGFGVIPSAIIALQLDNIISDTETIVTDLTPDNSKLSIHLSADTMNRITKSLIKPMAKPTVNSIVGLDTSNTQKIYKLGTGLQVINGDTLQAVLEAGSYTLADATPDTDHQTVTAAEKAQISTNAADISNIKEELKRRYNGI